MPTELPWSDVAVRLALTVFAGGCIGLNRGERGQPAGLRTTILVCVAASVSMIQANLMLATKGRSPDSFIMMDLMRLPLGVLSGMGFIGAGAILRRGQLVTGITTAATLWYVTIMGLCFGGGQLSLGLAMLVLGISVLWALKQLEERLVRDHHVCLNVVTAADGPNEAELHRLLDEAGLRVQSMAVSYSARLGRRRVRCSARWRCRGSGIETPAIVGQLAATPGVIRLEWQP